MRRKIENEGKFFDFQQQKTHNNESLFLLAYFTNSAEKAPAFRHGEESAWPSVTLYKKLS